MRSDGAWRFMYVVLAIGHVREWDLVELGFFLEGIHAIGNVRKFSRVQSMSVMYEQNLFFLF
jgi:hypothetical protein